MKTEIEKLKEEAIKIVSACVINELDGETGHIMDHVTNLLFKDGEFDEDFSLELTSTCRELLALLADPGVSEKLPAYIRPTIGKNLLKMLDFFENINDPACMEAFDLYEVKHCSPKEDRLNELINHYSDKLAKKYRKELDYIETKNRMNRIIKGLNE